jgi:nucleotide-binding universal stress UspA family protein
MNPFGNILVATDFGEAAGLALAHGRELARRFEAVLHVMHVVDDLGARLGKVPDSSPALDTIQAEAEAAARLRLESLLTDDDRAALRARTVILTSPAPAVTITSYARDEHVDLIVIGTHGRGPVARFLLGSVADRVLRLAACPVLVVRPPGQPG